MEKCLICQQDITGAPGYCLNCRWPTGFNSSRRDAHIDAAVVNWSGELYQEYLKLINLPISSTSPTLSPDYSELEIKTQKLTVGLKELNDACIKERQHFDRRITVLNGEMGFLKSRLPDTSNAAARISNLEEQHVRLMREMTVLHGELSSLLAVAQPSILATEQAAQPSAGLPPETLITDFLVANNINVDIMPAEQELVQQYNCCEEIPDIIRRGAIDVSLDANALNRLRDGDISHPTFNPDRKGNFLVVPRSGYQYLVPNKKRSINSHIHKTVKCIYTCQGYYEDYSQLLLLKPAIVREFATDVWQLSQPGVLQFK
jgi:hypothetical protein